MTGWPANPNLVRHLKSTLIWTGVHVDEAVMGLSVHTDEDGGGDNPLLINASLIEAPDRNTRSSSREDPTLKVQRELDVCPTSESCVSGN